MSIKALTETEAANRQGILDYGSMCIPDETIVAIIDRLAARVAELEQERDAAVAKLIPTKDGARVGHGDTVYAHHPMGLGVVSLGVECVAVGGWEWSAPIQATYSTKSAALASKGEVARGE